MARWLAAELDASPARVATFIGALDSVQNAHLPRTIEETLSAIRSDLASARGNGERDALSGLLKACELVKAELGDAFTFLRRIFAGMKLDERAGSYRKDSCVEQVSLSRT